MLSNLLLVGLASLICSMEASNAQYQYPLYQPQYPYQVPQYPYQQQQFQYPYQQQQLLGGQYQAQQQQLYYPGSGSSSYSYPIPNFVGNNQYYPGYPVRESVVTQTQAVGTEYGVGAVSTAPVIATNTQIVEAPEPGGHYEIYEYGRDGGLYRGEIEREIIREGPVGGQRIHRPFSVNLQRKPHYEIYKWGRNGFY